MWAWQRGTGQAMADVTELIPGLPPWAQLMGGALCSLGVGVYGMYQLVTAKRAEAKAIEAAVAPHETFDPDELLEAGPVVRFLANVDDLTANARLQTEALRNISAVFTLIGKRMEDGYSELMVFKAVHEALKEERTQRAPRAPRGSGGRSGP